MSELLPVLFSIILALLFLHEMDAVKNAEWKMFVILKNMDDEKAYRVFSLLHLPLYAVLLLILISVSQQTAFYIVDIFLIAHTILHLLFERHPQNGLKTAFSRCIIYTMGALAAVHLICLPVTENLFY